MSQSSLFTGELVRVSDYWICHRVHMNSDFDVARCKSRCRNLMNLYNTYVCVEKKC